MDALRTAIYITGITIFLFAAYKLYMISYTGANPFQ